MQWHRRIVVQALFETMQMMGSVSQRNDPKGGQNLNFVTLAQQYVLFFIPLHMLMMKSPKFQPKHEMTLSVTLPFPFPQRKHYKCSLIEGGVQRRLHLYILGLSMGVYLSLLSPPVV